jgi:hypothetical protein
MAEVIFCVDLTLLMRVFRSFKDGIHQTPCSGLWHMPCHT